MTNGLSRALLGALAFTALAACGGSTEFEVRRTLEVRGVGTGGTSIPVTVEVDLRDAAGKAWDQREHVEDVTIEAASGSVTAVASGNTAETGDVLVVVGRPVDGGFPAATLLQADDLPIAVGTRLEAPPAGVDAASDQVREALEGDGRLRVALSAVVPPGTTADFTAEVVMRVEVEWSPF